MKKLRRKSVGDTLKVTRLGSGRVGISTLICLTPNPKEGIVIIIETATVLTPKVSYVLVDDCA